MSLSADELKELRRIHVLAGRRVDALLAGDYKSAVRGRGMEFEEVRAYVPGDDVRHIDWNVTARTGEPFIKVFREERQMTVQLVVDVSGSGRVGSGGADGRTDKRLQMARIAGGIAYASIRNRDRVGLTTFTDRIETHLTARATRGHVWAVIREAFAGTSRHRATDLAHALAFVARTQKRRATLVVVSDFLDDDGWQRALSSLCRRHTVHCVLVHDELDAGVMGLGLVELLDAETGARRLVDARRWLTGVSVDGRLAALRRCGARAVAVATTDDAYTALHRHFASAGRGR